MASDTFLVSIAEVVELVDALASGASGRKPVGVRVPPSALQQATEGNDACLQLRLGECISESQFHME